MRYADTIKAQQLSPRTLKDYVHDAALTKAALGRIPMFSLEPRHVATFRDERSGVPRFYIVNKRFALRWSNFSWT
jgi:hypothetical protein